MELKNKCRVKAFTLVELVVVITILAILGTIAFLSFQGYSTSARNSTRVSDLSSIKSSLELYSLKVGKFPDPSQYSTVTYSGGVVWYQGTVGNSVIKNLGTLNKNPKDPLVGNEYSYSITNTKGEYQLGTIEEGGYGYNENEIIPNSYAANTNARAIITGNYNGQLLKINTGGLDYILALPGILTTDTTVTNIQTILGNQMLAYNGYGNLPGSYNGKGYTMTGSFNYGPSNPVVFIGDVNNLVNSGALQQTMINSLQTVYNGTQLTTDQNIARLLTTTTALDKENLMRNMINNKVGGVVSTVGVLPSVTTVTSDVGLGVSGACTGLPSNAVYYNSTGSYSLSNATGGISLSAIIAGYNASPSNNTCQYKCDSNSIWNGSICNPSLYSFSSHTFTNCGQTGTTGPALSTCRSSYSTTWDENSSYFNMVTNGIQEWTVPITGTYRIDVYGAQSGYATSSSSYPGRGANMKGDFSLTKGQILRILIGQQGGNGVLEGGGGGGTFVTTSSNSPLIIAGGGGGPYTSNDNRTGYTDATINNNGRAGISSPYTSVGGSGGSGGSSGSPGNAGAGGGGLTGNGEVGYTPSTGGSSFVNGGIGGAACSPVYAGIGGFGGGGGSEHCQYGAGGGGGGYSGGGGSGASGAGGGGGSYNAGTNQTNTAGVGTGNGSVTITKL